MIKKDNIFIGFKTREHLSEADYPSTLNTFMSDIVKFYMDAVTAMKNERWDQHLLGTAFFASLG